MQGFFLHLLEKDSLAAADRARGKFRAFHLASLKNFLLNEHDKAGAQKRGGRHQLLSLDSLAAEARYAAEPADDMTPERLFERRWTLALLDQVLPRLREEYARRGHENLFTHLKHLLIGEPGAAYARIAHQLAMTEGSVKVAAHRLRRRYRELLREEIAQTLSDPALIDEEIRQLLATL